MPQVIFRFHKHQVLGKKVEGLGIKIRELVALATTTEQHPVTENDVEWIPQPYEYGAIVPTASIEIRTIGYPDRKKRLSGQNVTDLKMSILCLKPSFPDVRPEDPLIWVQFIDPDGVHV